MLVAPRWLGEGSTVVANAERVKDAAEASRSGDPLVHDLKEVANRVEGAMALRLLPPCRRSPAATAGLLPFRSLR
jgi:hypothetical protein